MSLTQSLISSSKYDIKCPYSMNPIGICVHNTANDASAKNEVSYMKSNNNEVSFHIAIDDVEAIQAIPFNRNAWAAGDGGSGTGNRKYIHVEICYSKSGGQKFLAAEQRAAKEIAALLKQFGWGISNVKKHQDFSGKYCPHRTLDMGYQRFLNMIEKELGTTHSTQASGVVYRVVAGSYSERANAESTQAELKAKGYDSFLDAFNKDGKAYLRVVVGSFKDKANADDRMNKLIAAGFNAFVAVYNDTNGTVTETPKAPSLTVGSKVRITGTHYVTGQTIPSEQKGNKAHTVMQITGDRVLLKEIYSWVYSKDVCLA